MSESTPEMGTPPEPTSRGDVTTTGVHPEDTADRLDEPEGSAGGDLDAPAEYMPGAMLAERLDADGDDLLAVKLSADALQAISRQAQRLGLLTPRPVTYAEADVVPVELVEAVTGPVTYRDVLEFCAETETDDPHETVAEAEAKKPPRNTKAEKALRDGAGVLPTTVYALADVVEIVATGSVWAQRAVEFLHDADVVGRVAGARRDAVRYTFTARELLAHGATADEIAALPRITPETRAASAELMEVQRERHRRDVSQQVKMAEAAEAAAIVEMPKRTNLAEYVPADEPWIVEGLWGIGAILGLFAARKAGKSTAVREVIRPILNGGSVFGHFPVHVEPSADVVLIDSEMTLDYMHAMYTGARVGNLDRLALYSIMGAERSFDVRVPEVRARWVELIAPGSIVIFDCLYALLGALGISENDDAVAEVLLGLRSLMTESSAAGLMLVHHLGKDSGRGARGHGSIEGITAANCYIELDGPPGGGTARTFRASGRAVDVPTGTLTYAADRLTFESGEDRATARRRTRAEMVDEAVLDVIIDKPGLSGKAVIAEGVNDPDGKKIGDRAVYASIERLTDAHKIVNHGTKTAPILRQNTAPGDPFAVAAGGQK